MGSNIQLMTIRDLQGENPLFPSSKFFNEFILFNMGPGEGIWLVDKQLKQYPEIKEAALFVAKTFGDTAAIEKINSEG